MKDCCLGVALVTLALSSRASFGRGQKSNAPFPHYQKIKPKSSDIVDHAGPNSSVRMEWITINLFDYPKEAVTYLINGNPMGDVNYVKELMADKGKYIESIAIGKPDLAGKRVIEIKYDLP